MPNFFIVNKMCIIFSDEDLSELKNLFHAAGSPLMNYSQIEDLVRSYLGDNFVMEPVGPDCEIDLNKLGITPNGRWIEEHKQGGESVDIKIR